MPRVKSTCSVDECERPASARGWCKMHYKRWHRHGHTGRLIMEQPEQCEHPGCSGKPKSLGYCGKHYARLSRHGTTNTFSQTDPALERFWFRVGGRRRQSEPSACWEWNGALEATGYGRLKLDDGSRQMAHRFAYELLVGPIPDGLEIDHLCRNRACSNPWHLEPVTRLENWRRGMSPHAVHARKVRCKRGHPFDEENTLRTKLGHRACRACARQHNAAYRERRRNKEGTT